MRTFWILGCLLFSLFIEKVAIYSSAFIPIAIYSLAIYLRRHLFRRHLFLAIYYGAIYFSLFNGSAQLTYQSRPIVNLFNFFFHPIFIRFGLGANFGLKRTWNKFEITKALCRPKADLRRALCWPKAGPRTALFSRIYI